MPISKLGQRRQVVIPKATCKKLWLQEGDFVEVTSYQGSVMIKPKKLVDADEVLTPEQKAIIDARPTKALEDFEFTPPPLRATLPPWLGNRLHQPLLLSFLSTRPNPQQHANPVFRRAIHRASSAWERGANRRKPS